MNMPPPLALLGIRAIDPRDTGERARLDAFVRAHPQGTPFHLPARSVAGAGKRGGPEARPGL